MLVGCAPLAPAVESIPNLRCSDLVTVATTGERFDACTIAGAHWHAAGIVDDDIVRKAVIASAAHDVPCDESHVAIALLPRRSHALSDEGPSVSTYFDGSRDILVDGCGQRLTYVEACDEDRPPDTWGTRHFKCNYALSAIRALRGTRPGR
jgi:hypothetical protein